MPYTYKMFNDWGMSIRVDLYLDGKYCYISSKPMSIRPDNLRRMMEDYGIPELREKLVLEID
jgi:hypothetical protein